MELPPGKIIFEKVITQREFVGVDDAITTQVRAIFLMPHERPGVLEIYNKETYQKLYEISVEKLVRNLPPMVRAKVLEILKNN